MLQLVFHYCTASYSKFLEGADTFEDIEANLAKEISELILDTYKYSHRLHFLAPEEE